MLTNFHTHSTFSDGENTPEEIVLYAIENGYKSIGFSDHSYTDFDLRYCLTDEKGYISEITNLKEKYKNKIQIYIGIEEDIFSSSDKKSYDYMICSSHYFHIADKYYPIDSNYDYFKKCLEAFDYDIEKLSTTYYETLCKKIEEKKPDIVGHFDVITKFDELDNSRLLSSEIYLKTADKYMNYLLKNDFIFEINTGAIARGVKTVPYPHERLLHIIKKQNGKVILSSDSHRADTLTYYFEETKSLLKSIGFRHVYVLLDGKFQKRDL